MGRNYRTAERNFKDDFIFEPNLELAQMALAKKDNDIKNQVASLDLMENLKFDYWKDADGDNAEEIKAKYDERVSEIASKMQKGLLNTGANNKLINSLRKDVEHDFEFGDIRNLQDNAAAYKEFEELLKAMPNPSDRTGYKKMVDNYLSETEGKGALNKLFKPDELYNQQNYWTQFLESAAFKNLKPEERASNISNVGGKYMVTNGNQKEELSQSKIGQAFKAFIDSNNLEGYGTSRQKYFDEQWLNEEGGVRMDPGSYLGGILEQGVPTLAYSKTAATRAHQADPFAMLAAQEGAEIRREKRAAKAAKELATQAPELPLDMSRAAGSAIQLFSNLKGQVDDRLKTMGKKHGLQIKSSDINTLVAWAKKNKRTAFGAELESLKKTLDESYRASYEPLRTLGWGDIEINKYKDNLQKGMQRSGAAVPGRIDFTGAGIENATGLGASPISVNQLLGKKMGSGIVAGAKLVEGSSYPMFLGGTTGFDDRYNQVQSSLELKIQVGTGANARIETKVVDFYQPSYSITGDNSITKEAAIAAYQNKK